MLELHDIVKKYSSGDNEVLALNGVSLKFRKSEFVSILGPSGCGKTTMLNIIGGLDRYTDGDLIIGGVSTKEYRDRDWDTYRNHSIGFVFQSYNLIPHQSVLSNVELALTLSGVSKHERRQRAKEALQQVGLGDQLHKKPSQMSGGQMQRVAIARALVNNPEILLADEPTGALDTATSVQIMELLKEVAADRLVIMVTHNPELAAEYSTRIVRLSDGKVIDDSMPYEGEAYAPEALEPSAAKKSKRVKRDKSKGKKKHTSMSFFTAISLSMKNLMTKKGRTALTSFAGSIGIIGIALVLAVSTGVTGYINDIQRDTLSSFPISIYSEEADLSSMMSSLMQTTESAENPSHENDAVYSNPVLFDLIHSMTSAEVKENNLKPFKTWLDKGGDDNELKDHVSGIHYTYDIDLNMYVKDPNEEYTKADISELFSELMGGNNTSSSSSMMSMNNSFASLNIWSEMIPGSPDADGNKALIGDMIYDQYDLVTGEWPKEKSEVVLVLNKNNEISDIALYSLGYVTKDEMMSTIMQAMRGDEDYKSEVKKIEYSDIIGKSYKLILNDAYYNYNKDTGLYDDVSERDEIMKLRIENGYDVKISGIIRPKEDASSTVLSGTFAYTSALTEYVIEETLKTELAIAQQKPENSNFDIFTGLPFVKEDKELTDAEKLAELEKYISEATTEERAELYLAIMTTPSDEYVEQQLAAMKTAFGLNDPNMTEQELRQKLADLLATQAELEGLDPDSILALMGAYTKEQIEKMLDEYLIEAIVTSYREAKTAEIRAQASAPSAEQLANIKAMIEGQLPEGTTPIGYVAGIYAKETGLSPESFIASLSALGEDEINKRYDTLLTEQAYSIYEANMKPSEADINASIAAMFDSYYASEDADKLKIYNEHISNELSPNTYDDNLKLIGVCDLETPSEVHIYANTFEDKDEIAALIEGYNQAAKDAGRTDDQISYTDYVAMLMSSVTTIINAISWVLIAFIAISLVVSSVMIGIITNISVLERTKEIGILRAIGASKKDISRVFNAETFIIGLCAGLFGIITTIVLCFPISAIVRAVTEIPTLTASLPALAAVILVLISMFLTMFAGLIPARTASKKDPVEALRSE